MLRVGGPWKRLGGRAKQVFAGRPTDRQGYSVGLANGTPHVKCPHLAERESARQGGLVLFDKEDQSSIGRPGTDLLGGPATFLARQGDSSFS